MPLFAAMGAWHEVIVQLMAGRNATIAQDLKRLNGLPPSAPKEHAGDPSEKFGHPLVNRRRLSILTIKSLGSLPSMQSGQSV
jgi:hypothetical protein